MCHRLDHSIDGKFTSDGYKVIQLKNKAMSTQQDMQIVEQIYKLDKKLTYVNKRYIDVRNLANTYFAYLSMINKPKN